MYNTVYKIYHFNKNVSFIVYFEENNIFMSKCILTESKGT